MVAERSLEIKSNTLIDEQSVLDIQYSDEDYFLSEIDSPNRPVLNSVIVIPDSVKRNLKFDKIPNSNPRANSTCSDGKNSNGILGRETQRSEQLRTFQRGFKGKPKSPSMNKINRTQFKPRACNQFLKNRSIEVKKLINQNSFNTINKGETNTQVEFNHHIKKFRSIGVNTSPIKEPNLCKCRRQNKERNKKRREQAKTALQFAKKFDKEFVNSMLSESDH